MEGIFNLKPTYDQPLGCLISYCIVKRPDTGFWPSIDEIIPHVEIPSVRRVEGVGIQSSQGSSSLRMSDGSLIQSQATEIKLWSSHIHNSVLPELLKCVPMLESFHYFHLPSP